MKKHDINRAIIENTLRLNLKNLDSDPTRCIRRLVDIGRHFSKSILQSEIFDSVSNLFEDNDSPYFNCLNSLFATVNKESLIRFGTNLGYESWTKGAKMIRISKKEHDTVIPWIIELHLSKNNISKYNSETLKKILRSCEALGIFSFFISFEDDLEDDLVQPLYDIIRENTYYNFCLKLSDNLLSERQMKEISTLPNVLTLIKYNGNSTPAMSEWLVEKALLHGYYYVYDDSDLDLIKTTDILDDFSVLSSPIICAIPEKDIGDEAALEINNAIQKIRFGQHFPVLLIDFYNDIQKINKIISDDSIDISISAKLLAQYHQ